MNVFSTLRSIFLKDAPLKVVALGLALIIWYGAEREQPDQVSQEIPLELRNLPEDLIMLSDPPQTVRVRVRGRGPFLKFWLWRNPIYAVIDASECVAGVFVRQISVEDVILPAGIDAEVAEILDPRMMRVECGPKLKRRVAVEPVLAGMPPEGFTVVGSPRVSPAEVELTGPAPLLEELKTVLLQSLELSKSRGMVVSKRKVDLAGLPRVQAIPSEVEVIVTVEEISEVRFPSVPVRVEGSRRGRRETMSPAAVSVLLSGPASALATLDGESLVLSIEGARPEIGSFDYRTNIVGVNRVVFLPTIDEGVLPKGTEVPHLSATITLPPQVQVVEILPSSFSLLVEKAVAESPNSG